jgi:predicted XRE-type DNA-binding protein
MAIKAHRSTGNVFRDLGFSAEEAESMRIRADLMVRVGRFIQGRNLTQAAAAKLFGVTQPRVSDLVRGRIDLFSIDTLIDMLARVGVRVRVTVRRLPSKSKRRQAA